MGLEELETQLEKGFRWGRRFPLGTIHHVSHGGVTEQCMGCAQFASFAGETPGWLRKGPWNR